MVDSWHAEWAGFAPQDSHDSAGTPSPPSQSLIAMVVLLQPAEPWKAMFDAFSKAVKAPASAHERLVDVLVRVADLPAPERPAEFDFARDLYMREDEVSRPRPAPADPPLPTAASPLAPGRSRRYPGAHPTRHGGGWRRCSRGGIGALAPAGRRGAEGGGKSLERGQGETERVLACVPRRSPSP